MQQHKTIIQFAGVALLAVAGLLQTGCTKLVTVDPPINSITTVEVFAANDQAAAAMAGAYSLMMNGNSSLLTNNATSSYASGLITYVASQSADELILTGTPSPYSTNKLTPTLAFNSSTIWSSAYKVIYACNAIVEGIEASTAPNLKDSVRKELLGEAKFVRAFSYLYLVSFFGDVPLVMTVDFNKTQSMARTPKNVVFQQIMSDLKDAYAALPVDYSVGKGERIIPNKYAAAALLARACLYQKDYANAAKMATEVINNTTDFTLLTDLNTVFLKNSREAIWQLQQNANVKSQGNATPEGIMLNPLSPKATGRLSLFAAPQLLLSFEPNDKRRKAWIDSSTTGTGTGPTNPLSYTSYPAKYKTGTFNFVVGATPTEYYMVIRLAEMYLIRAEAEAKGANGGEGAARTDLNALRTRAGLPDVPATLSGDALWRAIAHERQVELFCEWGHRWLDLIRMGLASETLSAIPLKQPWLGDYQLLYPVPVGEIGNDHNLTQNEGYY